MSLVVTVYVPSGIVMAADSRITGTRKEQRQQEQQTVIVEQQVVISDNAYKIIEFTKVPVGISAFGAGIIKEQTVDSHVRAFEEEAITERDTVLTVPQKMINYFQQHFPGVTVGFFISGFRQEKGVSVPYVYVVDTMKQPTPKRINADEQGKIRYGVLRGGDTSVIDRLVTPQHVPLFAAMPLQDAIDYAIYLIRTTIDTLRFEPRFPTVGGDIDVLVITPQEKPHFVQKKELHGE